jgi:hypothetical protein
VTPVTSVGAPPGASVTSKLERHNQKRFHPLPLPISPFKKRYFPPIQTHTGAPLAPSPQILTKYHYKLDSCIGKNLLSTYSTMADGLVTGSGECRKID